MSRLSVCNVGWPIAPLLDVLCLSSTHITVMLLLLVMVYVVRLSEACGTANDCCICPPGTRLGEGGTCDDPQCTPCQSDEYMTSYNRETICHLQPYCDPNLNFETRGYCDGTKRHTCRCKDGFHCSNSDFCILCIPHSTCQERFVSIVPGNHTHDVVSYCDASVSVYTFPLGHSITSHGLGQMEAIPLSTFLNRCKQQNEFT
uniref:TNFR-Cys domain-containing protein n=1 Tax=Hucho hucho TaxID=62062 RepID=A0A4W5KST3_9TELE